MAYNENGSPRKLYWNFLDNSKEVPSGITRTMKSGLRHMRGKKQIQTGRKTIIRINTG